MTSASPWCHCGNSFSVCLGILFFHYFRLSLCFLKSSMQFPLIRDMKLISQEHVKFPTPSVCICVYPMPLITCLRRKSLHLHKADVSQLFSRSHPTCPPLSSSQWELATIIWSLFSIPPSPYNMYFPFDFIIHLQPSPFYYIPFRHLKDYLPALSHH